MGVINWQPNQKTSTSSAQPKAATSSAKVINWQPTVSKTTTQAPVSVKTIKTSTPIKKGDNINNIQNNPIIKQAESIITKLSNGIKMSLTTPTLKAPIPKKDIVKSQPQQKATLPTLTNFDPKQKRLTPVQMQQVNPDFATKQITSAKMTPAPKVDKSIVTQASKALKKIAIDGLNSLSDSNPDEPFVTFTDKGDGTPVTKKEWKKMDTKQKIGSVANLTLNAFALPMGEAIQMTKEFSKLGAAIGVGINTLIKYLNDPSHSVKDAIVNPENIIFAILGGKLGAKGSPEEIIKPGEHTPQEVIDHVVQNDLTKTPDGQVMMKNAMEAKKTGQNITIEKPNPAVDAFDKNVQDYRSFGGKSVGKESPNAALRDIETAVVNPEVQAHTKAQVQKAIDTGEVPITDGEITLYRGGNPSDVNGLTSATYDKTIAQKFADNAGGVLHEFKVKPDDIQAFIGKDEKEVLVKNESVQIKPQLKVSKIAKEIEAKAVEKGFAQNGLEKLAGYSPQTFAEQSKLTTDLINNHFDDFKAIIKGEKPLPKEINPSHLITAAEEYIAKNPNDIETLQELAKSAIVSKSSEAAQILGAARTRDSYSPLALIKEIQNDKKAVIEKSGLSAEKEIKSIKKPVKVPDRNNWDSFIKALEC